ncbi:MAG: helix-turn-helix domain-containing protein [Thermomicrobiales bacterium]
MLSVADIIELALPPQTSVVAGRESIDAEVSWATRPRPSAPAFDHLSGGELVLLTQEALTSLDQRLTLEAAIRQLSGFGVAAIAFAGKVPVPARQAADETRIPLLQLPAGADLALLEREASHFIAERKRDAQKLSNEAGRRLMEQAIAGESLPDLAASLAEMASLDVIIEARDGQLLAMTSPSGQVPTSARLLPVLERSRPAVMAWLRAGTTASSAEPPTTLLDWDDRSRRVVSPIIGRDGLLGVLSILLSGNTPPQQVTALASRGAAACAVVMARERAAAVARQELELNVLDEVLDGALRSEVSLLHQARLLGHDLDGMYLAVVARVDRSSPVRSRAESADSASLFAETFDRREPAVLWRYRNKQAEAILPVESGTDVDAVISQLALEIEKRARTLVGETVSIGVGGVHAGPAGIRRSHDEARQALTIGRRLNGPGRTTHFSQLGIYRLLFAARDLPELRAFHDDALSALIDYDQEHNSELVKTLGAFFDGKCGPKEASAILGVHRNTVLYRLQRIQELTGLDLDDAEVRLRLHLAYCSHVALYTDTARISTSRMRGAST